MSKNTDRYKADLIHVDVDELEELETPKFERFHPKKQKPVKGKQGKNSHKREELD